MLDYSCCHRQKKHYCPNCQQEYERRCPACGQLCAWKAPTCLKCGHHFGYKHECSHCHYEF